MSTSFLSHADAALRNRNTVLHFVKKHGPISRTEIWERMEISRASVTQVIRQLQEAGLILEEGEGDSTGGRKPRFLKFNGAAKRLFAFDWPSRTLALTDLDGVILYEEQLPEEVLSSPARFFSDLNDRIDGICAKTPCEEADLLGLSISMPGLIDHKSRTILYSAETGWKNVCLDDAFSHRFGKNIFLERITHILALGAYHMLPSASVDHFQLLMLGPDGIGAATVICGRCQHGANYMHGELGHVKIPSEVPCSCGQVGCLEAVLRDTVAKSGGVITEEVLRLLAITVSTAVNLSDPSEVILVGNYVNEMTPEQKELLETYLRQMVTGERFRTLKLRFADDVKPLAFGGLVAHAFDRYFPID